MSPRVTLHLAALLSERGLGRQRLRAVLPRTREMLASSLQRSAPPPFPGVAAIEAAVGDLGLDRRPIVVAGAPGSVLAARAWVEALAPGALVQFAPAPAAALEPAGRDSALVALLGPPWVEDAIDAAVSAGRPVLVAGAADVGERVDPPPGGRFLRDPWCGDGPASILGAGVLAVARAVGVDLHAARAGAEGMAAACAAPGLVDNPALSWAAAAHYAEVDRGLGGHLHLAEEPALLAFAAWAATAWSLARTGARAAGPLRSRTGGPPTWGLCGDDELLDVFLEGPPSQLLVAWSASAPSPAARFAEVPHGAVELPAISPAAVAGAATLVLRAAAMSRVLAGLGPRLADGVTAP